MAFRYEMTAPGAENVQRVRAEPVLPDPGEVQLRMRASCLNYHDFVTLIGLIPTVVYPRVPLSDGSGLVEAVGEGVDEFRQGDRVLPLFYPLWHRGRPTAASKRQILGESVDGCLQQFLTIDHRSLVVAPANLSDAEAATLPCAALTAWYALFEEAKIQAGHTVLVQGTGGVSLFALQFAKAHGARVVATSSSNTKLEQLKALGADDTINYAEHPDWDEKVLELTGGVEAVVDVGGQGTLPQSIHCAATDATVAVIGVLGGFESAQVSVIEVMQKNLAIKGITVGCAESFDRMCRFIEEYDIKPVISHTFHASELPRALEVMQSGDHFGKISILVD